MSKKEDPEEEENLEMILDSWVREINIKTSLSREELKKLITRVPNRGYTYLLKLPVDKILERNLTITYR